MNFREPMTELRHLINADGSRFDTGEMASIRSALAAFSQEERESYRNANAATIASHPCNKLLIVSGPGTGKSYLFIERIKHWLKQNDSATVFVTSFVRKLVADLKQDIDQLPEEQKTRVTVSTLHSFARSVVEQNHGTSEWGFAPYFRIIGQSWKDVVWNDACSLTGQEIGEFTRKEFEKQMYENKFLEQEP